MRGWDPAKVSDLLNGKGGTTEIELAVLLGACKTPVEEREHLLALYRESTAQDWFQAVKSGLDRNRAVAR